MDEFTGRTMPGRRWGDGLHQAVEAKERLPIQNETVTLASISYQVRPPGCGWLTAQGLRLRVQGSLRSAQGLGLRADGTGAQP